MQKVPMWFVVVAVVALLWNLLGCFMIFQDVMLTPEDIAKLPADMQAVNAAREQWMVIGSVVGVAAGALGSLGLVLKQRWAGPLLFLSVLGLIAQDLGFVLIARNVPIPQEGWILQGIVLLIAIGLVMLAGKAKKNGWLR